MKTYVTVPRASLTALLKEHTAIWAVAFLGLLLSGAGLWAVEQQLRAQRNVEFEWVAGDRINAFRDGMARELDGIHTIGDFLQSSTSLKGLNNFALSLSLRHPGINGLWWIPREMRGSEKRASADAPQEPANAIRPMILPKDLDSEFSLVDSSDHLKWLTRAREAHQLILSDRVSLPDSENFGLLAYLPIQKQGAPASIADELNLGVVVALLDVSLIAKSAVSMLSPRGVEFRIFDESAPPDKRSLGFYTSRLDHDPVSPSPIHRSLVSDESYSRKIKLGDRFWSVACTPIAQFRSAIVFQRGHWLVLGAGISFTLIVALYLLRNKQRLYERLGLEQVLQEREELFWQMTETVNDMFFWAVETQDYEFLYISPGFKEIWGIPGERVYRSFETYRQGIHPKDRDRRDDLLVQARQGKTAGESVYRVIRPDRSMRWVSDSAYPVRDDSGEVVRIVGVTRDITSQKTAELAMRRSADQLRRMFNQSPDILAIVDSDGRIKMLSRSLRELPAEQAKGHDATVLVPLDSRRRFRRQLDDLFSSGKPQRFSYALPEGTRWEVRMVTASTESALVIASDVTEYQRLQEQMLHSARLASVGALAAGVAHEINNPNNAIHFAADLLRRVWRDAVTLFDDYLREQGDFSLGGLAYAAQRDALARLIEDIGNNSERIRRIVENLKHLVRDEPESLVKPVNLREILDEVVVMLNSAIREHTDAFHLEVPVDIPRVRGNAQQLEQLFINLVLNALEALPHRSAGVRVRAKKSDAKNFLEILIEDEGEGISAEDLPRLCQPFFSTKTAGGGTGLGLSIAATIAKRHLGELRFDSTLGRGTTVTVRFPTMSAA